MNVLIGTGLALVAIIGACLFVLWYGSAVLIDQLEDRIEVLERNWAEQFGPPVEDEPAELRTQTPDLNAPHDIDPDADTGEIPVCPPTQPDGIAIQVHTALIERPSPVPRDLSDEFPHPVDSDERKAKNAADIDERLKQFNFSGRNR